MAKAVTKVIQVSVEHKAIQPDEYMLDNLQANRVKTNSTLKSNYKSTGNQLNADKHPNLVKAKLQFITNQVYLVDDWYDHF